MCVDWYEYILYHKINRIADALSALVVMVTLKLHLSIYMQTTESTTLIFDTIFKRYKLKNPWFEDAQIRTLYLL